MQQVFAPDGGLVSEPYAHYKKRQETYEYIADRLEATREAFLSADRTVQTTLLFDSATNAIISANTRVDQHEPAFLGYLEADDRDGIQQALEGNAVLYYNNKTEYIVRNMEHADLDGIIDDLEAGNLDDAHRAIVDEFDGLGVRKAAFTLCMLGFTEKMCIDANVARKCGLDPDDIYEGVVVEKYEAQCRELQNRYPRLADEVSPFIWQWVVFDTERGGVTMHDPWFMAVEDATGEVVG